MNDFGVLCHQNARIIFSNSTMSKIALRFASLTLVAPRLCFCSIHPWSKSLAPSVSSYEAPTGVRGNAVVILYFVCS